MLFRSVTVQPGRHISVFYHNTDRKHMLESQQIKRKTERQTQISKDRETKPKQSKIIEVVDWTVLGCWGRFSTECYCVV